MKNDLRNVLCLPVPETYDISMLTMITAHPNYAPWPKREPQYVCFIKKGGLVEKVFKLKHKFYTTLEDVEESKLRLSDIDRTNFEKYYYTRCKEFGFHEGGEWAFYICYEPVDVEKNFYVKHVRASKFMRIEDIPIVNK